jgi:hypothetical protein
MCRQMRMFSCPLEFCVRPREATALLRVALLRYTY